MTTGMIGSDGDAAAAVATLQLRTAREEKNGAESGGRPCVPEPAAALLRAARPLSATATSSPQPRHRVRVGEAKVSDGLPTYPRASQAVTFPTPF